MGFALEQRRMDIGHVTVGKRTPRSLSRNYQTLPSLFSIRWYSFFLAIYRQYDPIKPVPHKLKIGGYTLGALL